MLLDSLFTCYNNKPGYIKFYQWEKAVQMLLYQCFARVRLQKKKK